MKTLLNEFKNYMVEQNIATSTISCYMGNIELFIKDYNINMDNLELLSHTNFIKDYKTDLLSKLVPGTVNVKISSLKCFARFLIVNGYIENSPVLAYKNVKLNKKQVEYFPEEDIFKLLDYFKKRSDVSYPHRREVDLYNAQREYIMVLMLATLGMRISELMSIKMEDIKGVEGNILAIRGKGYRGEVSRHVKIPVKVVELLNMYINDIRHFIDIKNIDDSEYLWISALTRKKVSNQALQVRMKQVQEELEIGDIFCHKLRHSFCTNAIFNNILSVDAVADIVGHANSSITQQIYIAQGSQVENSVDVYEKYLSGKSERIQIN